jgi:hypothetical protein
VIPVESVDGQAIGDACPGPVTTGLQVRFQQVVRGEDPDFVHWLNPVSDANPAPDAKEED